MSIYQNCCSIHSFIHSFSQSVSQSIDGKCSILHSLDWHWHWPWPVQSSLSAKHTILRPLNCFCQSDVYSQVLSLFDRIPPRDKVMTDVVVYSDGTCSWVPVEYLTTSCPMGGEADDVICTIKYVHSLSLGSISFKNHSRVLVFLSRLKLNLDYHF